jgi:DNA repair protein RadA/Sms
MTKTRVSYRCGDCGLEVAKWVGRCPECQAWGTVEARGPGGTALARVAAATPPQPARPIVEIDPETARARQTGVSELDRVLGGGLVPGAVALGPPRHRTFALCHW